MFGPYAGGTPASGSDYILWFAATAGANHTFQAVNGARSVNNGLWMNGALLQLNLAGSNALEFSGAMVTPSVASTLTLSATNTADTTFSGVISRAAGLVKTGSGRLILSGDNTYTGTTQVQAGTLLINGNQSLATGAVTVTGGATLGGSGRMGGAVTVTDGTLSPGESIESLGSAAVTLSGATAGFEYELNTTAVTADLLYASGSLTLTDSPVLTLIDLGGGDKLAIGTKFTLISYNGTWNSGTFAGYADNSIFAFAGNKWLIDYNDLTGGDNFAADQVGAAAFLTMTVIPEPASFGLLALGALALARRRR